MIRKIVQRVALVLGLGLATSSFAADPLPGMWSFDGELTGKPGRGFQIDTQGSDLLIVSYFGYRTDGSALFLQASGPRASDGTFSADLVEYRGGTVLGGPHQDGEQAQVVGRLQATFDSPNAGSITLPGEATRRVNRFQYVDNSRWFNNLFIADRYMYRDSLISQKAFLKITAQDGAFRMTETEVITSADGTKAERICLYEGTYEPAGAGLQSEGIVRCDDEPAATYRSSELSVNRDALFFGRIHIGESDVPRVYQGYCQPNSAVFTGYNPRCKLEQ